MLEHLRSRWTKVMSPIARALLSAHVTPDMVTWAGTIGVVAVSLICFPHGWLWQGVLLLLVFIFSDSLDGIMARTSGRSSDWGAFLDSTLDRIADGAVMGGLALYYVDAGNNAWWAGLAIVTLVLGQVTSYTKARGESLGYEVNGGLAGRADRLLVSLLGGGREHMTLALGIVFIPSYARIVRSEFARARTQNYVRMAELMGASTARILFVHILPNIWHTLLSAITIGFNNAVLAEAAMSYLSIGISPDEASLGYMLSESQSILGSAPWYALGTGLIIVLLILGVSLIGEGLQRGEN